MESFFIYLQDCCIVHTRVLGEEAFLSQVVLMFFPLPLDKSIYSATPDRKAWLGCIRQCLGGRSQDESIDLPSQEGCKGSRGTRCYEVMNLCYWSETDCPRNQGICEIHQFERLGERQSEIYPYSGQIWRHLPWNKRSAAWSGCRP